MPQMKRETRIWPVKQGSGLIQSVNGHLSQRVRKYSAAPNTMINVTLTVKTGPRLQVKDYKFTGSGVQSLLLLLLLLLL